MNSPLITLQIHQTQPVGSWIGIKNFRPDCDIDALNYAIDDCLDCNGYANVRLMMDSDLIPAFEGMVDCQIVPL